MVVTGEALRSAAAPTSPASARSRPGADDRERGSVVSIYEGFLRVLRSPLPTIAAVNGPAVGAGMNLALACDVRLIGNSGRFDARFLQIGLHPGGGHTWMLERAVGPQAAAAIVLFGEAVEGARAVEIGLAWSCHPDDELLTAARALGARAAKVPKALSARAEADPAPGSVATELRRRARHRDRAPDVVLHPRLVQHTQALGDRVRRVAR